MKPTVKRFLAMLVTCALLFALVPSLTRAADDAALEGYVFPDDWSHDALVFAVQNGIFVGDANKNLFPERKMTRAELATVITQLLHLEDRASLSAFKDVSSGAWYYDAMSATVAAGILAGTSATTLAPNQKLTREQAVTIMCRAFGVIARSTSTSIDYADASKISPYARSSFCAMLECDIIHGYADNTLRPRSSITRAQVAQLLYQLVSSISDDTLDDGFVVYRGSAMPESVAHKGSLLLTASLGGKLNAHGYRISRDLILRTRAKSNVTLTDLEADNLVCLAPDSTVAASGKINIVSVSNHVIVNASGARLIAENANRAEVNGNFSTANIRSGSVILNGNYSSIQVAGNTTVTLNGHADTVTLYDANITITGSGSIGKLVNYSRLPKVSVACAQRVEHIDYALEGVKLKMTAPLTLTKASQYITLTASISGGIFEGKGVSSGKRSCKLNWYCNGKLIQSNTIALTKDGLKDTYSKTYDLTKSNGAQDKYRVELIYGTSKLTTSTTVTPSAYWVDYAKSLSTVKTANVPLYIQYNCNMYSDRYASSVIRQLKAGEVVYNEYNPLTGMIQITYPATGQEGWVYDNNVEFMWNKVTDSSKDYSVATKEGYINLKGYSSTTGYLAWVSKYTQRVNVFEGSKGNWKLVRTILCSSGTNETPTPKGVFSIFSKLYYWYFEDYFVYNPTVFNGGHAFHSVQFDYNGRDMGNTLGVPQSHGCIRVTVADSEYLSDLPMGTTVVVY